MICKHGERMLSEFWKLTRKMRAIVCEADLWLEERHHQGVWTCFLRSEAEQKALFESGASSASFSVHQLGRGADLRLTGDDDLDARLADHLNDLWQYDPARPDIKTALIHGGTAMHMHLQSLT